MARIVHKLRFSKATLQIWSSLIIMLTIGTSYLQISILFKVLIYAVCFLLNFKLIEEKVEGHKVSDEKLRVWKQRKNEMALANLSDDTYNKIKDFVIENQRASVSLIERTFNLDWLTADAVINKLYEEGVVGEICDHEPREVIMKKGGSK